MKTGNEVQNVAPDEAGVARESAILDAAAEVFFAEGYARASINAIIARAGGSKRNIYEHFGSKQGLFEALIDRQAAAALATLENAQMKGDTLEETLTLFARHFVALMYSPTMVGIFRSVIMEGVNLPELARRFFASAPAHLNERLAGLLTGAEPSLGIADARMAADRFTAMLRGNLHLQLVLGLLNTATEAEKAAVVQTSVASFLYGFDKSRI